MHQQNNIRIIIALYVLYFKDIHSHIHICMFALIGPSEAPDFEYRKLRDVCSKHKVSNCSSYNINFYYYLLNQVCIGRCTPGFLILLFVCVLDTRVH